MGRTIVTLNWAYAKFCELFFSMIHFNNGTVWILYGLVLNDLIEVKSIIAVYVVTTFHLGDCRRFWNVLFEETPLIPVAFFVSWTNKLPKWHHLFIEYLQKKIVKLDKIKTTFVADKEAGFKKQFQKFFLTVLSFFMESLTCTFYILVKRTMILLEFTFILSINCCRSFAKGGYRKTSRRVLSLFMYY